MHTLLKDASDDWLKGYVEGLNDARRSVARHLSPAGVVVDIEKRQASVEAEQNRRDTNRRKIEQLQRETLVEQIAFLKSNVQFAKSQVDVLRIWSTAFGGFYSARPYHDASAELLTAELKLSEAERKLREHDAKDKPVSMADAQRAVNAAASAGCRKGRLQIQARTKPAGILVYDDEASKRANADKLGLRLAALEDAVFGKVNP